MFFSVTVKPIWSPAETLAASAVLSTSMAPQLTSTEAVSESDPSFVVDTAAVFSTAPQSPASVVATTCTEVLAPAARVAGANTRFCPSIDQPAEAGEIDQLRPAGRTSVNCTPLASPSPVFSSVTVNPIWSPAETLSSSATFCDVDDGAVDVHGGRVGVRAVVGRRHRGGVVDLAAVLLAGGGDHVHGVTAPAAIVVGAKTRLPFAIDQPADAGEIAQSGRPGGRR